MTNKFLSPCACGGKPWFNLGTVYCLACGKKTKRLSDFAEASEAWNYREVSRPLTVVGRK